MKLPKLDKDNSISEIVYQNIYKQIISGKLEPGQRITEINISQSMGISRAPVREALKRLSEDRLVVLIPRSGCYIADLTPEEIEEIYEIRKRLESMALEYAFNNLNLQKIHRLRDKFKACRRKSTIDFVREEVRLDCVFHRTIADQSNSPNLQEMLGKLRARMQLLRVRGADYTSRAKQALSEHLNILNAITNRDKPAALKQLEMHIENTKRTILSNFKNTPKDQRNRRWRRNICSKTKLRL